MMRYLFCALFALSLFGEELLDYDMSAQERKHTGVYKLSAKEKAALQKWIDAHYEKRETPLTKDLSTKHPMLSENLQNGRYLRMSDGTLWEVNPQDRSLSQGWITPVEILISPSKDPKYPYKLTNSVTGSSLFARQVPSSQLETSESY